MTTIRDVVARGRNLVSLPEVYLRIRQLLNDPNSSMVDFSTAVQSDPALSARVLQIANSAFFGVNRKVETLSLAISLMGIARLHDLALATSVIGSFRGVPVEKLNMRMFWRRSIHSGILARMLAVESSMFDSERLFVAGLLHDIGHLVMYMNMPTEALAALDSSRQRGLPLHEVEKQMLGFHYGNVGAELMTLWSFPESLHEVCRMHVEPANSRSFERECSLVCMARHMALSHDPDPAGLPWLGALSGEVYATTGVGEIALQRIIEQAARHLEEVSEMLLPSGT